MNTDKITENLYKQAISYEKQRLESAAINYRKAIGLSGMSETIRLKDKDVEIYVSTTKIFEEIAKQLLLKRDAGIKTKAVNDFLNKFDQFSNYMHQMENYMNE